MDELNNLIRAYECCNGPWYKGKENNCPNCPYSYFDDRGDGPGFWSFNEEKWEQDAYTWLKIYEYLIKEGKK